MSVQVKHVLDAQGRLLMAQVGSCNCQTKTSYASSHSKDCAYRILWECVNSLDLLLENINAEIKSEQNDVGGEFEQQMLKEIGRGAKSLILKSVVLRLMSTSVEGYHAETHQEQLFFTKKMVPLAQEAAAVSNITLDPAMETLRGMPEGEKKAPYLRQASIAIAKIADAAEKMDHLEEFADILNEGCQKLYSVTVNEIVALAKSLNNPHH